MTGRQMGSRWMLRSSVALLAAMVIAGCDETAQSGEGALPAGGMTASSAESGTRDVERPDIFEVSDRGLWDGRPSLGGVWVAHPDVTDPERVIIRNPENGKSVIGALFRRERENPGPLLQMSSDAAEALGILPGAPTAVTVVALRREEVEAAPEEEVNPVIASLDAPVSVAETPLDGADPVAGAAAAIAAAEAPASAAPAAPASAGGVTVNLPPAAPVAAAAAAAVTADPAEAPAPTTPTVELTGLLVQIGVFSVQANADAAASKLTAADVQTIVVPEEAGGRTVWRVVSGPSADAEAQTALVAQIKELGFVDAFGFEE